MFEREHHRRIARILESLDADLLAANACLFGGGTAITLRYGEYRESLDIDFLVSDTSGFRTLRERLSADGIRAIARAGAQLDQVREMRADQYGIRTMLAVDHAEIKLEIIRARITLEEPSATDRTCGVATLTTLDLATSKLLANSDRWADASTHSRDLIDLAMMKLDKVTFGRALDKARDAYGKTVDTDLAKAIESLRAHPARLDDCMRASRMVPSPAGVVPVTPAELWKQIRRLAPRTKASRH